MATSSIVMLSNISMERLYLSQPPAWNDLQRLPIGSTSFSSSQPTSQQDHRTSQQNLRTCYEKLLHHIYDMNSSSNNLTNPYHQLHEQLKLAAEFCQLQISSNKDTIHLYSEQFYIQVKFDSSTHLPSHISFGFTHDQSSQDESSSCPRMLRALNEKQYRLFRSHLNGYASLFSLTTPTMNNGKRVGFTAYNVLQQDVDRLAKTELYGKLFEGFEPFSEGLPMRIRLNDQAQSNSSIPSHLRIVLQTSPNQYYLPMKSSIHLDEKTNQIHLDCSNIKTNLLATGHFALEIEENQSPLFLLMSYAQDISRLTSFNHFLSNTKPSNYLLNILPKTKLFNQYQWYISHDQSAISIRQIPFTNIKQLVEILTYLRQQIYLTKSLHYYFHLDDEHERMDDDRHSNDSELFLELSLLSPTLLSMTCAQSYHLSTFILQLNQIETFPLLIHRQQQREISLTTEKSSLWKCLEQMIDEENTNTDENSSMMDTILNYSTTKKPSMKPLIQKPTTTTTSTMPKLNRRLSCGPPAKPTWRSATSLRRLQPACFTLISREEHTEKVDHENLADDSTHNTTNQSSINDEFHAQENDEENYQDDDNDDDEIFISITQQKSQQGNVEHPPILPRPLSFHPSTLSRCTSVSSTQSVSTPPIFGLTPSTPYPGGSANQNENIFFPLAKQVSVPDFNPVSPTMSMGSFDPSAFLPANPVSTSNVDPNNKIHVKKKRRRSDVSADDIIQSINTNPNDNRSIPIAKMPSTPGAVGMNSGNGDPSNAKRGKKPIEKSGQSTPQQSQHQIVRQKSSFKVTDSPTAALLSQNQLNSPDETPADFKPLKVVIKRVDGGSSSNDESQQSGGKPRKKIASQQQISNTAGAIPSVGRKLNSSTGGSSPSISIKSEAFDVPQINSDMPLTSMMSMNESGQSTNLSFERMKSMPSEYPTERPRPSSSLSNPSSSLASSSTGQPRSAPPPIVVKINRSKVLSAQDQPSSTSASATGTSTIGATGTAMSSSSSTGGSSQNTIPATVKDALQKRNRPSSSGGNVNKTPVTSPPLLAAKVTSPLPGTTTNPLAAPNATIRPFRIPRKPSSQEVTAKPKIEPNTANNNNVSPALNKSPLLPTPSGSNSSDSTKPINKSPVPSSNIRPPPPTAQIGSWQSPPTQQPPRFHQNRARASWTQPQPESTRGRAPITPPNVAALSSSGHSSSYAQYAQQPRSILKKPSGNDSLGPDLPFVPSSDLVAFHEQRGGANFSQTSSSLSSSSSSAVASALLSRNVHSPSMYEDNDDDSSPQAQLVIDTSSSTANNALLPYTLVSGSNSASTIDSYDPTQENHSINSMGISSASQQQQQQQQHQQQQHYHDEHSSILD